MCRLLVKGVFFGIRFKFEMVCGYLLVVYWCIDCVFEFCGLNVILFKIYIKIKYF